MDIKQFEYVITIAESGSLSLAAERLFLSQPNLSKFLTKLENELGTKLFIRTSFGTKLTKSGEIYVDSAQKIMQQYRRAQNKINDIQNLEAGRVDFGISTYRGSFLLPGILKKFNTRYPNVDIVIHEHDSVVLEELTSKGKLDMALIAKPDHRKGMASKSILEDEVVLVAHKDFELNCEIHPFDNGGQWIELETLLRANVPFILSPPRTILGNLARSYFKDAFPSILAINQNCSAEMAVALASEGLGVAFNYRSCFRGNSDLKSYSIGFHKRFVPLLLMYPADSDDYKCRSTLLLAELIKEYFNQK